MYDDGPCQGEGVGQFGKIWRKPCLSNGILPTFSLHGHTGNEKGLEWYLKCRVVGSSLSLGNTEKEKGLDLYLKCRVVGSSLSLGNTEKEKGLDFESVRCTRVQIDVEWYVLL